MNSATGIIPARYQSSRFPGKPLALIQGRPMIQWVYEGALSAKSLDSVIIATDDERIREAARGFGAPVVMTSPHHGSGTERVAEVASRLSTPFIVNIQGDEPLINGQMLDSLVQALRSEPVPMVSLMRKVQDIGLLQDPNRVKVVVDNLGFALYFSRSPIPYHATNDFFHHLGIYGYQRDFLLEFCKLAPSRLEQLENLEQLRALENGFKIKMVEVPFSTLSVDSPRDIIEVENCLGMKTRE
ncbi:MAG: 3-deoxy-manno-octulosonate cytidylyltransferase [Acidobacteriota bacterium]|nr:3-deoxy-manno-octulosonate cytidylyltransferase [Acidobacteriota bacterium]